MISNSISTGYFERRGERQRENARAHEKKYVCCQTIYVIHTSKTYLIESNYVDIIDRRFFTHIHCYYLIHISRIQLITFDLWQGSLHLLKCMVIRWNTYSQNQFCSYCIEKSEREREREDDWWIKHENKRL